MKTHYETLGVAKDSTPQQIRSAYRKLVLVHHPDRSTNHDAAIFLRIQEAYETLGNEERRGQYDTLLVIEEAKARQRVEGFKVQEAVPKQRPAHVQSPVASDVAKLSKLFTQGRFVEAEGLARRILAVDDRQAIPYAVLGDLARSQGNLREALKMYAFAVQMDPRTPIYQKKYEEIAGIDLTSKVSSGPPTGSPFAILTVVALTACAAAYLAISKEPPLFPTLEMISTWTLGLIVMLFLVGVALGASLSAGRLVDSFQGMANAAGARLSPTMALATVALANFWAASLLYVLLGIAQGSLNYSTSRIVGGTAALTCAMTMASSLGHIDGSQVLFWGGNLIYVGAICGWLTGDSLRQAA